MNSLYTQTGTTVDSNEAQNIWIHTLIPGAPEKKNENIIKNKFTES